MLRDLLQRIYYQKETKRRIDLKVGAGVTFLVSKFSNRSVLNIITGTFDMIKCSRRTNWCVRALERQTLFITSVNVYKRKKHLLLQSRIV